MAEVRLFLSFPRGGKIECKIELSHMGKNNGKPNLREKIFRCLFSIKVNIDLFFLFYGVVTRSCGSTL